MWIINFILSVAAVAISAVLPFILNRANNKNKKMNPFHSLLVGIFVAAFFMFLSIHSINEGTESLVEWRAVLLSLFNSMQIFTIGAEFDIVSSAIYACPKELAAAYQVWAAAIYVLAPVFTFGFVLSLFKNLSAYVKYFFAYFKEVYVFSELNEKSLILAEDLKMKNKNCAIVFTDVFEDNEETAYEFTARAKSLGAICFKKDLLAIDFNKHSNKKKISFFTIGDNETENLNQALNVIENYKTRNHTHLYVFSVRLESELLLTSVDKGEIKVRRINHVQALINRVLFENGNIIFESAKEAPDGIKDISAVIVGMGRHGTEMTKALSWFGQMDGYRIEINAFERDPLAKERFEAEAPELMSPDYNGVTVEGEAQYKITVNSGIDVETVTFTKMIYELKNASYVLVSLGNDDININTAVNLRMLFERMGIHPVIQAIVYNTQQKKALTDIKNYRGQAYDIEFIGDLESCYTENVIVGSELENDALRRHLKWGEEEEFWTYEYNYRSSVASAIHMRARIKCGIPGADKKEEELTLKERDIIETLEHRRWNAYMRSQGYVYSGSKDKSSRNDLAKMHHDLVDFASLSEEEKRKDSSVGTN